MPRADQLSPGGVKLLQEKQLAIIATVMPDGSPQTTPVWVDVEPDGSHILINTVLGHLKANNINRDPRVAVTVVDSQNPWRAVVIRGTVVDKRGPEQGATEHIHKLARKLHGSRRVSAPRRRKPSIAADQTDSCVRAWDGRTAGEPLELKRE